MNQDFNRNEDAMKLLLSRMRQRFDKIAEGGGKKAMDKQREKNKLSPRERIQYLIDADKPFIEIGAFAGYELGTLPLPNPGDKDLKKLETKY